MALYNLTWINQSNTIMDLANGVNMLSGGSYFYLVNVLILIIFTISLKQNEWQNAALAASVMNLIITSLFYFAGIVGNTALFINIAVLFAAMIARAIK